MGQVPGYTDVWGAPEIFCEGVAYREMVGTDIVRSVLYSTEQGERIIRVKLLLPFAISAIEERRWHEFIRMQEIERRMLAS